MNNKQITLHYHAIPEIEPGKCTGCVAERNEALHDVLCKAFGGCVMAVIWVRDSPPVTFPEQHEGVSP